MRIGNQVFKYVEPMDCRTWVHEVDSVEKIPMWVTYFGEDDEVTYYVADYLEGEMWGVRKEEK